MNDGITNGLLGAAVLAVLTVLVCLATARRGSDAGALVFLAGLSAAVGFVAGVLGSRGHSVARELGRILTLLPTLRASLPCLKAYFKPLQTTLWFILLPSTTCLVALWLLLLGFFGRSEFFGRSVSVAELYLGGVAALLPVPFYFALASWLHRFEFRPPWDLAAAFGCGASVAVALCSVFRVSLNWFLPYLGPEEALLVNNPLLPPLVAEPSKSVLLLFLYWRNPGRFAGAVAGTCQGAMLGLGFGMGQAILLHAARYLPSPTLLLGPQEFLLDGALGPFGHPLYAAIAGWGLGVARQTRFRPIHYLAPISGFALSHGVHFAIYWWYWDPRMVLLDLFRDPAIPSRFWGPYKLVLVASLMGTCLLALLSLFRRHA